MRPILSLRHVTKRFGETAAVQDVSLDLKEGEFLALLGPSGCGKSTCLRLLAGLDRPSAGHVQLGHRDVTKLGAAERNIALMFQSYALYPHLTVYQNIAMPLRLRSLTVMQRLPGAALLSVQVRGVLSDIDTNVRAVADMLGLTDLLGRKPGQLSGGQQQRAALARALVRAPSAFLLDEPLSNLDIQLRAETREEIKALHRRTGYPFLVVTHDQADALSMADRVAVMMAGRISQVGTPHAIYHTPATREVAQFIGQHRMNILPRGAGGALHPAGAKLDLGVRPEHLAVCHAGTCEARLPATVESISFQGDETLVRVRGPGDASLLMVLRGADAPPEQGASLHLTAVPGALHAFGEDGDRRELAA
ncbi:MAG: ABC transporter ATP-binding protein [Pseudomonadota bacterium]